MTALRIARALLGAAALKTTALVVLGLSAPVRAQPNGVEGTWIMCPAEDFRITLTDFIAYDHFESRYSDADFVAQSGGSHEEGTYMAWGDSLALHIIESDFASRTGTTVVVTYSVVDFSITFTNARELTCGYVDEERVTLTAPEGADGVPFGWWEIYDWEQLPERVALFGVHLASCGSFYSYGPHGREWGTFVVHGDSLEITISESEAPDRQGARFVVTFSLEWPYGPGITFTNAPMLTAGFTDEETITLMHAMTGIGVRPKAWGELKRSAP